LRKEVEEVQGGTGRYREVTGGKEGMEELYCRGLACAG